MGLILDVWSVPGCGRNQMLEEPSHLAGCHYPTPPQHPHYLHLSAVMANCPGATNQCLTPNLVPPHIHFARPNPLPNPVPAGRKGTHSTMASPSLKIGVVLSPTSEGRSSKLLTNSNVFYSYCSPLVLHT